MAEFIYFIKKYYHWFKTGILGGFFSAIKYKHPEKKLKIITITGTDGKTTTSTLVYELLKQAGFKVGLISTVAAYIGNKKLDTGFHVTSPHPKELYNFMAKMVEQKIEYLVLEVTSQGAYQWRNWGIHAEISGLTNVDKEHLDYHLDFDHYLAAKMLVLNASKIAVVNDEQLYFGQIKKLLNKNIQLLTYNKNTRFSANLEKTIRAKFNEDYNRLNAYLALTIAKNLGCTDKDLAIALEKFVLPAGRMEIIPNDLKLTVIVDFAHTSQALEAALTNIRKNYVKRGQLIGIVGCAGLRDRQKRPKMGQIIASLCDIAILTSEDPRTENIWSIFCQMKEDISPHHARVISIPNREEALQYAIEKYSGKDNTIAIFGKGHEESMCYDGITETPWNDITGAKKIIRRLEKKLDKND